MYDIDGLMSGRFRSSRPCGLINTSRILGILKSLV